MSEEAKLIHARIYPGYKYQPRRKQESATSTLKTSDSPAKKGKSKKTAKSGKECITEEMPDGVDTDDVFVGKEEQIPQSVPQNDPVIPLQLPETSVEVATTTIETEEQTGDPTKDWTWLPEQTLFPISWEPDQEIGNVSLDVMNPLDANVDNENENDEIEFGVRNLLRLNCLVDIN